MSANGTNGANGNHKSSHADWTTIPAGRASRVRTRYDDVLRLARLHPDRVHARAAGRRAAVEFDAQRAVRSRAGRDHRQPGHRNGAGRAEGDLRQRLASGRRRQHRRRRVSRPKPLSVRQRAESGASASIARCCAPTRSNPPKGKGQALIGLRRSSPTPKPASAAR